MTKNEVIAMIKVEFCALYWYILKQIRIAPNYCFVKKNKVHVTVISAENSGYYWQSNNLELFLFS